MKRSSLISLLGLLIFNLSIRLLWIHHFHPVQQSDFLYYYSHAVQVAHGLGYVEAGHYTDYFPMGYIFFLAALFRVFGSSPFVGMVANVCLSTGIVLILYLLVLRIAKKHSIAFISAFGYSLLPSQIAWNSILGTEELFTFTLLLSALLYILVEHKKPYWMAVPGIFLGIASVVRPVFLLFPIFLFGYEWLIQKKRFTETLLSICVFTVAMFVAISPATIRNFEAKKEFTLVSTNGGVNLWQGIHTNNTYFWSSDPNVNPLLKAGYNEKLRDQIAKHEFEIFVFEHPKTVMLNGIDKIYNLYKNDASAFGWYQLSPIQKTKYQEFSTFVYLICLGMSVTGFLYCLVRRVFMFPMIYIVYNTAVFFFFPAWDRFRYPIMPFWFVFFGVAVHLVFSKKEVR